MLLFDDGVRRLFVSYVQLRRDSYYYRRRYPQDLSAHFGGQPFKVLSLQTKSPALAAKAAARIAQEDDATWEALRVADQTNGELLPADATRIAISKLKRLGVQPGYKLASGEHDPLSEFLDEKHGSARDAVFAETGEPADWAEHLDAVDREMIRIAGGKAGPKLLSDALAYYLKEHERGTEKKFAADNTRSVGHVLEIIGNRPLPNYLRADAEKVRDALLVRVKTQTVRRHLNDIGAVFAKGITGFNLQLQRHAFQDVEIINEGKDATIKETFKTKDLERVVQAIRDADDTLRHLAALLVNTGARISEMVGLKVSDVVLDHAVPHVIIQPHNEIRRTLKTPGSERVIPLVGISHWAATRTVEGLHDGNAGGWLFPRYVRPIQGGHLAVQTGSATVSVNNWLKRITGSQKTSHCFRHTLKDRLRGAEAPKAIQDAIGGWGTRTVADGYGEGHTLEHLQRYLLKVAL
jgi:integrase